MISPAGVTNCRQVQSPFHAKVNVEHRTYIPIILRHLCARTLVKDFPGPLGVLKTLFRIIIREFLRYSDICHHTIIQLLTAKNRCHLRLATDDEKNRHYCCLYENNVLQMTPWFHENRIIVLLT